MLLVTEYISQVKSGTRVEKLFYSGSTNFYSDTDAAAAGAAAGAAAAAPASAAAPVFTTVFTVVSTAAAAEAAAAPAAAPAAASAAGPAADPAAASKKSVVEQKLFARSSYSASIDRYNFPH